ncbi:MAG TPA: energy transducer TonB [Terriglobales bacterium]
MQGAPVRRFGFRQSVRGAVRALALTLALFASLEAAAQNARPRVVKTRVAPVYPRLAQQYHLEGSVNLAVIVAPNGHVKSSKVIGGNPLLAQAAQEAIKKWEFEPAQQETTEVIAITFQP